MKRMLWLSACFVIVSPSVQAGELFRWVDKSGKVHYSDVPPAGVTDVERKKYSSPPSQSEDLPYETLRAKQNFPVKLYVANGCGAPCDQARTMLNKRGIPFSEISLKTREEIDAFNKTTGSNITPTLAIGKNHLSGFLESRWNAELDLVGYPKTPSYRQRVAPPVPASAPPATENQRAPEAPAAP